MNKEFTKFSIHNHFGGVNADRCLKSTSLYSFDLSNAINMLDDAKQNGFMLLGFTNHNIFKKNDFLDVKKEATTRGINLIPGVELDVASDNNTPGNEHYLHTVVVFDENTDLDFLENKVDEFVSTNNGNYVTIQQLCQLVVKSRCIVCPHGRKQGIRGAGDNPDQFLEIVGMFSLIPIFIENNKLYQKEFVKNKLSSQLSEFEFKVLDEYIASISAADRTNFSDIQEPTYLWGDNSFDSLFYAAIIGKSRILRDSDFNNKLAVISKIVIKNNGGSLGDCELNFSEGLNTIIGPSGSGKTLLLNLIMNQLTGNNLTYSASSNSSVDYGDLYTDSTFTFYDKNNNVIKKGDYLVFEGECLYKQIVDTYAKNKKELLDLFNIRINSSNFDKYINDFNIKLKNYIFRNREMIRLAKDIDKNVELINTQISFLNANKTDATELVTFEADDSFAQQISEGNEYRKELRTDIESFNSYRTETEKILKKYNIDYPYSKLDENVKRTLELKYKLSLVKDYNNRSKLLVNKELKRIVANYQKERGQKFNNIFEAKTQISLSASQCLGNIKSFFLNSSLLTKCPVINKEIITKTIVSEENLYSKISDVEIKTSFEYDDITKIFAGSIGNSVSCVNKSSFKSFFDGKNLDLTSIENFKYFVDLFIALADNSIILTFTPPKNECIQYKIMMDIDSKNPGHYTDINKLSAGQLSKAYINRFLDEKLKMYGPNTIIVYDQPDNNLEKKFVLDEIANKLKELKLKYQIFITTHEPLLVINGDSNKIILAKNEKTIQANQNISFKDVSILDAVDKEDAINKVSTLIDGSVDALRVRTQLYGGMKKWKI